MKQMHLAIGWFLMVLIGVAAIAAHAQDDPWADEVVAFNPAAGGGGDSSRLLGEPVSMGPTAPANTSIVSLGKAGGSVILRFNTPVEDHPDNPMGLDCIVYSNAFWAGGNPQRRWQEPVVIEISPDGDNWYLIPGSRGFPYAPFPLVEEPDGETNLSPASPYLLAGNITNPNLLDSNPDNDTEEYNWGYAEMSPTMAKYLDNYVRPDDPFTVGCTPRAGGGDAFDIAWAVDADGNPANLSSFSYIRLTALVNRRIGSFGDCTSEIDAVAAVARDIDTDGDGILDDYEIRVAGTDPLRPESTVLPLEIPAEEGGSPQGSLLGQAADAPGNTIRLFADSQRTADDRTFNCMVDIIPVSVPGVSAPDGLLASGAACAFSSSEPDFVAAGIRPAEFDMAYTSADISGLSEEGLVPYRLDGDTWTQAGIADIAIIAAANKARFTSRYPGTFALFSTAGAGDEGADGPQGTLTLVADLAARTVADPANTVTITTTGAITDHLGQPVADGVLFTVAASRGTVSTPDADPGNPGVQVALTGGTVAFDVAAPTVSGGAVFSITSVEGSAYGELAYFFTPGPPVGPVSWTLGTPEGSAPVTVDAVSSVLMDQFGNTVEDGSLLTVEVTGCTIVSADADSAQPGHQVVVSGGRARVFVSLPHEQARFTVTVYADADRTALLGQSSFMLKSVAEVPALSWPAALVLAILLALAGVRRAGPCR